MASNSTNFIQIAQNQTVWIDLSSPHTPSPSLFLPLTLPPSLSLSLSLPPPLSLNSRNLEWIDESADGPDRGGEGGVRGGDEQNADVGQDGCQKLQRLVDTCVGE